MKRKNLALIIFLAAVFTLHAQERQRFPSFPIWPFTGRTGNEGVVNEGETLYTQAKPRLAILPFTGGIDNDGETIAELFSFEPDIDRIFTRIPRTSSIQAIMQEQQFQRSTGLTDSDTIAQLGRQLNADYVVAGHIQGLGASRLVLITIIHVESLQQVAGDYREYMAIDEVIGKIPDMARRIAYSVQIDRSNLPKLAVLPFALSDAGVNQSDAEVLAQLLATDVANSGRYAVLPRTSSIESVMNEHHIQRSELTETDNIRRIGQALNARYVLAGNVRRLGQANLFTAQILDVENATLLVGDRENYSAIGEGLTKMTSLSGKLTGGIIFVPEMVRIRGGRFNMGSPEKESNRDRDEGPQRRVTVSAFNMGKYPVTQIEYESVMGTNPVNSSDVRGPYRPVVNVSWFDAVEYCNRLSRREWLTPAYTISGSGDNRTVTWSLRANGYRLPTEAEWEYACRAGTTTAYNTGANITDNTGWYDANSGGHTHDVGKKTANAWGLYDMHGNIREWCWDWYGTYPDGQQTDPTGASSGSSRVIRGGSYFNSARDARSAYRNGNTPSDRYLNNGFRVVRP